VSRVRSFLSDRLGWPQYLNPFMEKPLPEGLNWTTTFGSILVLLFAIEAVTGMFLAFYYNPSPELAYQAVDFIMNDVFMGRILRGIHHFGASAMVVLVFCHLAASFFYGAFKPPRELTWVVGVCLLLLTLGFGFTGYLLPWDQKAYWATVVGTNIPRDIPLIGKFITRVLLGGESVSGLTLTRFYAIHTLILPTLTAGCIGIHIYLVRIHGISEHGRLAEASPPAPEASGYRFFPEHLARASVAFGAVFLVILLLAVFAKIPRQEVAGTIDPTYLPRPEWYYMWLFQLLTFFSGRSEIIGSLVIPLGGVALLFCLPFLKRSPLKHPFDRPAEIALGAAGLIGIVYLSITGIANSKPYGEIARLPDRALSLSQAAGLRVFVERECAYCHSIKGGGGRNAGPDLSNVIAKGRTKKWLISLIKDPQTVSAWSIMPKYALTQKELDDLTDFILALDFKHHVARTVSKKEALREDFR
jgi:quinol-cytochrome oxidoreductase complex cytochrome b subunit